MKKSTSIIALLISLSLIILLVQCDKAKDASPSTSASFTASVDGTSWAATTTTAFVTNGVMSISGTSTGNDVITITLIGATTGKYTLTQTPGHAVTYYNISSPGSSFITNSNSQGGGVVNVTEINLKDSTLTGDFSVNLYSATTGETKKVIENGKFTSIKFKNKLPIPNSKDYFSVKIDGASWTPASISGAKVAGNTANTFNIHLSGTDSSEKQTVFIKFPDFITPDTYPIKFDGTYSGVYSLSSSESLAGNSGKLIITKHDVLTKWIEGTFSFEASSGTKKASLTEGTFGVSYK